MKSKSKRVLSMLLTLVLMLSLFAAMPLTASAAGPLQITQNPTSATYYLGETAVPLKATFSWPDMSNGTIGAESPIKLQWYWTLDPLVTNR